VVPAGAFHGLYSFALDIIAVTLEQFTHLTPPDSLSKKARPPLKAALVAYTRLDLKKNQRRDHEASSHL